jgi:hypothetical protein
MSAYVIFAENVGSEGCLQAVSPECGFIGGDGEPEPPLVGAECEPKMPLVCGFRCHCLQAATDRHQLDKQPRPHSTQNEALDVPESRDVNPRGYSMWYGRLNSPLE